MTAVRGYFHPKTATGASSLIPSPPWRYSGDLLTVEYRTDPARVRELLPEPLDLADEDPGAVALIWADWQSCSASGDELLDQDLVAGVADACVGCRIDLGLAAGKPADGDQHQEPRGPDEPQLHQRALPVSCIRNHRRQR